MCFGRYFRSSTGALDCVYSLWYYTQAMLPAGDKVEVELVNQFHVVFLWMGEIIARNMLR